MRRWVELVVPLLIKPVSRRVHHDSIPLPVGESRDLVSILPRQYGLQGIFTLPRDREIESGRRKGPSGRAADWTPNYRQAGRRDPSRLPADLPKCRKIHGHRRHQQEVERPVTCLASKEILAQLDAAAHARPLKDPAYPSGPAAYDIPGQEPRALCRAEGVDHQGLHPDRPTLQTTPCPQRSLCGRSICWLPSRYPHRPAFRPSS